MKVNTLKLNDPCYPAALKPYSHAPKQLFWIGSNPNNWLDKPKVAIVGSRKITPYGKVVTSKLAAELAQAGVVIISGLAYGVDAVAHEATVSEGGVAVAVLPTPLDNISPTANQQLAAKIIDRNGTLISEYPNGSEIYVTYFVARNRIVSGLADALVITEAAVNSGTMHTARFALEQGKTVMAVPGNITSPASEGCNNLIRSGAVPVTSTEDILFALGVKQADKKTRIVGVSRQEQKILELIKQGISAQEELALASKMDGATVGSVLTMLEINGHIRALGAGNWAIN